MSSLNWNDDEQFLGDVRQAMRPEPVEEPVVQAARAAFSWLTIDADLELARMFYDSYLDEAVLVRGHVQGSPRTLVFRGEDSGVHLGVEIELSDSGIEGQLVPPGPGRVTLSTPQGRQTTAEADEVGCFSFPSQPRGPMRLECSFDSCAFTTEWITV